MCFFVSFFRRPFTRSKVSLHRVLMYLIKQTFSLCGAGTDQSVQRLAADWLTRGSAGSGIFSSARRSDRSHGYQGLFIWGKAAGT
jgi:hypothetical protein